MQRYRDVIQHVHMHAEIFLSNLIPHFCSGETRDIVWPFSVRCNDRTECKINPFTACPVCMNIAIVSFLSSPFENRGKAISNINCAIRRIQSDRPIETNGHHSSIHKNSCTDLSMSLGHFFFFLISRKITFEIVFTVFIVLMKVFQFRNPFEFESFVDLRSKPHNSSVSVLNSFQNYTLLLYKIIQQIYE